MRVWQCLAANEMLRYGESPVVIANSVGLPSSAIQSIKEGFKLADTFFLQYEKDVNRCPKCGRKVVTNCFTCYQKEHKNECIEAIMRPDTHKGFMLHVHLYKEG